MKVIKRLRNKMVITVLTIQAIVFALILLSLNFAVGLSFLRDTKKAVHHFIHHDIEILEKRNDWVQSRAKDIPLQEDSSSLSGIEKSKEKSSFLQNFFSSITPSRKKHYFRNLFGITYDIEGNLASILAHFSPRYTDEELNTIVAEGLNLEFTDKIRYFASSTGVFLYKKEAMDQGSLLVLVDMTRDLQTAGHLLLMSGGVYLFSILISALVAWFLAKRSVLPVEQAFETQKQFIADAGHELKTPISVIAANVDALQGEIGNNKWLGYIKSENQRMASLINDLLYLAKNDAGRVSTVYSSIDLSRVVTAATLPFESLIFEQDKTLILDIPENLDWVGDSKGISQVVVILLDNALKNSSSGSQIRVSLTMEGNRRGQGKFGKGHFHPVITVFNQGEGLSPQEMSQVFKRFYRSDTSRARETGGYGLGLSIAKAIAQAHGGSITVEGRQGEWIAFSLHLGSCHKFCHYCPR